MQNNTFALNIFAMKTPKKQHNTADIEEKLIEIGSMVRVYRKKFNKNYEIFAQEHNFNKVTLQRIESGKNYTMSSFLELLNIMNVSVEEFFHGIDTK